MKPMLAKSYDGQDVTGWLMSEKLDGVRAIWTGAELISRNGNRFVAPGWFAEQLPAGVLLDGELHAGRGAFQRVTGIIRKKTPIDAEWQTVRFLVFDAPSHDAGFEDRISYCHETLAGCRGAEVVPQVSCNGEAHLREYFSVLLAQGAEGVMLRRPGSSYEPRRSESLLKLKPVDSEEAEVIGHQPGEGKHAGRLGALVCRWRGLVFNLGVGISDATRESPPGLGAHVTFMYQGVTDNGLPRFPVFLATRDYE